MPDTELPSNPAAIAAKGQKVYEDRYRAEFERTHPGQFVAIDVTTEEAFVENTPIDAIQAGRKANPKGLFHLVKVGSPGVYRVGYAMTGGQRGDWIFGER